MHVSPAKHSYAWLSRKCDYRTDRQTHTQTDAGQSDPYVPLCFAGDTKSFPWHHRNDFAHLHFSLTGNETESKTKNITTQSVASLRTPHMSMIPIVLVTLTFEMWPPKSIWFTMGNMSAKFEEEAQNALVCIRFTAYFHICPWWPWPLTSDL